MNEVKSPHMIGSNDLVIPNIGVFPSYDYIPPLLLEEDGGEVNHENEWLFFPEQNSNCSCDGIKLNLEEITNAAFRLNCHVE